MSSPTNVFGFPLALANTSGVQPQIEKGTGSPNGVLSRPIGSLFLRTDTAQLWQNTNGGTTWTQVSGGSGGTVPNPTPNDYTIELGGTSDMGLGYFLAATTGLPADAVLLGSDSPSPVSVSGSGFSPFLLLSSNNVTFNGPGTGGSGSVFLSTGDAEAGVGSGGGTTGIINIKTGSFTDGAGVSGQSGDISIETGSSDSANTGDISITTGDAVGSDSGSVSIVAGNAAGNAGNVLITAGDGLDGGDIIITAGTSSGGQGGNIVLSPGSGTTNDGYIRFDAGIYPSPNNDTVSYNDPLAYGIYKSRTYITGTGPGVSTVQFVPRFLGEIEMVVVRNANVGLGDTLALTINGTNVFAPGGVAGPLTQAGGSLIGNDQFLPRLNVSGTVFTNGDTIQVAYTAAGLNGGAMVNIFVRQRT